MKIIICTTPIRPTPTDYPPLGSMAIITALRKAGYDPEFYDIDGLRPSFDEVIEHFRREAPDVIGISAVVSTAYAYVKRLCSALHGILPASKIVLGGNLAASAELLHRSCGIDVCVVGEGERIIVNLLNYYGENSSGHDPSDIEEIRGITVLDSAGEMVFTGYEAAIAPSELFDPDYSILEQSSRIENFIVDPATRPDFSRDPRSRPLQLAGKRLATIVFTKGCVARCTFCHRWDRGFRQFSPQRVIDQIQYLVQRYNVGFIQFGDENFGSDRRATEELVRLIKPLGILWNVAGVRARSVDKELLEHMKDAGCCAIYFGFETGSPDMLKVMEKNLELHHSFDAARWTNEVGLQTIYQLVLGMPGETSRTVSETIEMLKQITEFLPAPADNYLSVNYIQALPGTPVYEYARARHLIGSGLEAEGAYLERISNVNAADDTKFINFTSYPYLVVRSWRQRLLYEVMVHWYVKRSQSKAGSSTVERAYEKGGYFNLHNLKVNPYALRFFNPIRGVLIWISVLESEFRQNSMNVFASRVWELVTWPLRKREPPIEYQSLRATMKDLAPEASGRSEEGMLPLRLGR